MTGNTDEFGDIMMKKLKFPELEKMLDIIQIAGYQVIHTDDMEPFPDEPVAKM